MDICYVSNGDKNVDRSIWSLWIDKIKIYCWNQIETLPFLRYIHSKDLIKAKCYKVLLFIVAVMILEYYRDFKFFNLRCYFIFIIIGTEYPPTGFHIPKLI